MSITIPSDSALGTELNKTRGICKTFGNATEIKLITFSQEHSQEYPRLSKSRVEHSQFVAEWNT